MRRVWLLLTICALLSAPHIAWAEEGTSTEEPHPVILIGNGAIEPKEVHLPIGGKVTFRNIEDVKGGNGLSAVGGKFGSPQLRKDEEWTTSFPKLGRYEYWLRKSNQVRGVITVGGAPRTGTQ